MNPHIKELIFNVPLFKDLDHTELISFLKDCRIKEFKAGEYICNEGEYDENCGIILSGSANVELPQKGAIRSKKIPLGKGEIFGEIAALSGNPRTADIVASYPSTILNISRNDLFKLFDKFPPVKDWLEDLYRERALSSHLLTIPIFAGISGDLLEDLVNKVTLNSFHKDEIIFTQGDKADAFYLIRYGYVKISEKTEENKERVLAYLKDGHYFGEMALLTEGEKRMATVTAINQSELIKISRQDFQKLIEAYPSVKINLEKVIEKRKERNIEISKDILLEKDLRTAIDTGVIQTKAVLIVDQTKCIQCDNCVEACAALHNNQSRLVRNGTKLNNFLLIPTSCRHCDDPTCMSKCPTGAITRGFDGEVYHKDFCIGCGSCAKNCPFKNISIVNLTDGENRKSAFLSNLFSSIFNRKKNNNYQRVSTETTKPARFVFPGDRDMLKKLPSKRLPGDRDMVESMEDGKAPKRSKKKKRPRRKAVKCDMCRDYSFLGCVYNCPVGAARRVDPTEFFSNLSAVA